MQYINILWKDRVDRVLARVNAEKDVFINPRRSALDYQAALESVGKGLITFDGATFRAKTPSTLT